MRVGLGGISGTNILSIGRGVSVGGGGGCTPVDQILGSVMPSTTFTHPADGVVAWTQTTAANTTQNSVRRQDGSNDWVVSTNGAGNLILQERVGGTLITRATTTGVVTNGARVAIVMDGNTFVGYVNQVQIWSYTSSGNFATKTAGVVLFLGSSAISDLKTWTLACRAMEGV